MHLRRRLTLGLLAALLGGPALVVRAGDGDAVPAPGPDSLEVAAPDSLPAPGPDSLAADTAPVAALQDALINRPRPETETITPARSRIVKERVDLDNPVEFSAKDSLVIVRRDSAFMYGDGDVTYGDIRLQAAQIEMNLDDNTVYAVGRTDSVGDVQGKPIFHEGGSDYEAATMRYNFKTSKGLITNVVTQQGEGYLTGGLTKKDVDDSYYIQNGRYTTCDDHDDPHFYFQLTKAKVRPGKNVVTGPAYMVLAGLPLPLAVPFGYFPFSDKYASGVIVPTFGDDYN
ncbi:MAG: hypothetical protein K2L99_09125, partial [Muribaculaceae bacterium]|nr:hypothetical protein [Muribaculaceae bacterium]